MDRSLGEAAHDPTFCDRGGQPHLGPCIEPDGQPRMPLDCVHLRGTTPLGAADAWMTADRRYRWKLARTWNPGLLDTGLGRKAVFVMCNPSDGRHDRDDATLRRCAGFAKREGCAGMVVVNLSPKVAHRPAVMLAELQAAAPLAPWWNEANRTVVIEACVGVALARLPLVILAWGVVAERRLVAPLARQVTGRLALEGITPHVFGLSQAGQPLHPLFLAADTPLVPLPALASW